MTKRKKTRMRSQRLLLNRLTVPFVITQVLFTLPYLSGSALFNSLPLKIQQAASLSSFKNLVKAHFFS